MILWCSESAWNWFPPRKFSEVAATPEPVCLLDGPSLCLLNARLPLCFSIPLPCAPARRQFPPQTILRWHGAGRFGGGLAGSGMLVAPSRDEVGVFWHATRLWRTEPVPRLLPTHTHTVTLAEWGIKWNIYRRKMQTVDLFNLAKPKKIIPTLSQTWDSWIWSCFFF